VESFPVGASQVVLAATVSAPARPHPSSKVVSTRSAMELMRGMPGSVPQHADAARRLAERLNARPAAQRRLRLVQLVQGYPPAVGGVELSTRDLCEALVAEFGFDVTVLTTDAYTVRNFTDPRLPRVPIEPGEIQNGVTVKRFPVRTAWSRPLRLAVAATWRPRLPGNDLLRTLLSGPICPGMLAEVRRTPADVICAASLPLNHMRYPFRLGLDRPPIVLIAAAHTNDPWSFDRPNLLRLVNESYATVAHTEHERDWLVAHGARAERVRVIGHGVDPGELDPRPGAFRGAHGIDTDAMLVAFVGQQGAHKGIDTLIDVMPRLLDRCPSAYLVVGGSRTPYSSGLRERAAELPPQARSRVLFADDLTAQAKADLLGDCDVFASPSAAESFGITTLEAWSLAKPVVVGDAPSQSAIVQDGVSGLIVPHGNSDRLLDALGRLASDEGLRRRLGRGGRQRLADRFSRHSVELAYAELLRAAALSRG
jgi:glycosyltransferase involved in cell wall biosynthesis